MATKKHLKQALQDDARFSMASKAVNEEDFVMSTSVALQKRSSCSAENATEAKIRKRQRTDAEKKHERIMANRRSAKESRERRRALMKSLKEDAKKLAEEHEELNLEYEELKKALKLLQEKRRLEMLREVETPENSIGATGATAVLQSSPLTTTLASRIHHGNGLIAGACPSIQRLQEQKIAAELVAGNLKRNIAVSMCGGPSLSNLSIPGDSLHKTVVSGDESNADIDTTQELLLGQRINDLLLRLRQYNNLNGLVSLRELNASLFAPDRMMHI